MQIMHHSHGLQIQILLGTDKEFALNVQSESINFTPRCPIAEKQKI